MASQPSGNETKLGYLKGMFGLGAPPSTAQPSSSATPPPPTSAAQSASAPKPIPAIKIPAQRQDSMPEICMTPSDVGIYEVPHMKGKFTFKKLFQNPSSPSFNRTDSSPGGGGRKF
jgi:hypothetical protein